MHWRIKVVDEVFLEAVLVVFASILFSLEHMVIILDYIRGFVSMAQGKTQGMPKVQR